MRGNTCMPDPTPTSSLWMVLIEDGWVLDGGGHRVQGTLHQHYLPIHDTHGTLLPSSGSPAVPVGAGA
jgi:hypothetical protein